MEKSKEEIEELRRLCKDASGICITKHEYHDVVYSDEDSVTLEDVRYEDGSYGERTFSYEELCYMGDIEAYELKKMKAKENSNMNVVACIAGFGFLCFFVMAYAFVAVNVDTPYVWAGLAVSNALTGVLAWTISKTER